MSQQTVDHIVARFNALGIRAKLTTHQAVRTSEEAAAVRGVPLGTGVKALVCKRKDGGFVLVLAKGDERADLKKVALLEGSRLSMASAEEVEQLTDCVPGAVPPFGFEPALKTYFDTRIRTQGIVTFNIGLQTHSAEIAEADLEKALGDVVEY